VLRYLAIATVIVVGVFVAVGAWWLYRPHKALKVASVNASPAGPHYALPSPTGSSVPVAVVAGWALSAVPECLSQVSRTTGPLPYVRAHLPADAAALAPGSVLHYGDCTLHYRGTTVRVLRGKDRLTVPPRATLYVRGRDLYLLYSSRSGNELREYAPSDMP
jgi:hypothetical protein